MLLEIETSPVRSPADEKGGISVSELWLAFIKHAEQHYRRADGTQTHEVVEYKACSQIVRPLYGETLTESFGPVELKAIRANFIDKGWCRGLVNQRVNRVRRVFKWGVSEGHDAEAALAADPNWVPTPEQAAVIAAVADRSGILGPVPNGGPTLPATK